MAYCTKCGTDWPEDVHFCGKCGIPILSEPDTEPTERISRSSPTSIGGKTEPSEVETLIGAGKLAIKYSSILVVLFIGSIFLIVFGLASTFEFLAVVFVLILIYLFVKDSFAVQKNPTNPSESISSVPARDDATLLDDVASPLKTLVRYVIGGIGVLIVLFAALIMSSHEGTIVGYRFLLIVGAAISIYVVFKMPETSERINRNQKIAAIVGIIVLSYFVFNQIDEHVPLPTVGKRLGEQPLDQTTVQGFVAGFQDAFEKKVGFFQFVPEHEMGLREFKLVEVQVFQGLQSEGIESGKHPASSGAFLIGDFGGFNEVRVGVVNAVDHLPVECNRGDIGLGDGVEGQPVFGVVFKGLDKAVNGFECEVFFHGSLLISVFEDRGNFKWVASGAKMGE